MRLCLRFRCIATRTTHSKRTAGDLDVELKENTGDEDYLEQLAFGLATVADRFEPDLVFYLAGADPYEDDRLGLLRLTKSGIETP